MRLISENPEFPWKDRDICYIYFDKNLNSYQVGSSKDISALNAYELAKEGKGKIVAVWPGKYRSDAFLIDDLDAYAVAFGFDYKPLPIEIVGFVCRSEQGVAVSKYYDFFIKDDKEIVSFDDTFLSRFSEELKHKYGWTIAKSKGCGSHGIAKRKIFGVYVKATKNHPFIPSWGLIDEDEFFRAS